MSSKKTIKGHIRPRPNKEDVQYYTIILDLGKDEITGKRKRLYFKADTTDEEEAKRMLVMKQAEYYSGDMLECV